MRYSRLLLPFFLLLLASILPINSQDNASGVFFSPPRYYVGDLVTMQFKLNLTGEQELNMPIYEISERIKIEKITIDKKGSTAVITVKFRAYTVGTSYINLDFGSVKVDPISYYVSSLVEERGRELRSAYGPKLLVGTRLIIASIIMLFILLPPLIYFGSHFVNRFFRQFIQYIRSPYRRFAREISRLYRETSLSDKVFYFTLLESFRNFLSDSSGMKEYRSATERQLNELLRLCFNKEDTAAIIELYKRGDLVKFGGNAASKGQRINDIDLISKVGRTFYQNGGTRHSSL